VVVCIYANLIFVMNSNVLYQMCLDQLNKDWSCVIGVKMISNEKGILSYNNFKVEVKG
jgi:hypothetical protein